ncbi:MAG TPA: tetratricopeptide repeat protein [Burkholderiaceae bacterium]|nr:tetratricopeptide repeat protein [Burkholderiaceae bacterium]
MAYDIEEQEKLDALRDWWAQYGTIVVTLAFVAMAAVLGWRGWQWYQNHQAAQAMGYFEALESAAALSDDDAIARVQAASATLREDFPKSGYTSRGVLIAAQALARNGDLDGAAGQLDWLIQNSSDQALVQLARLRLAGVLFEQDNYDAALQQLADPSPAFQALYADRRGDILLAQGKPDEAAREWERALVELQGNPLGQIVQIKLDALAGA